MKIVSVNVGRPRDIEWKGEIVRTSIFKTAVAGRVRAGRLGLDGDTQSDLEVHGGEDKAVYAYPAEHYDWWRGELPGVELHWGSFGENLTVKGLLEERLHIGDRLRSGSAEFSVTEPRMPCYKLAARFGRADIVKRFLRSGRTGFYLAVVKSGEIGAGDAIELAGDDQNRVSVASMAASLARRQDSSL